jgi:two-component system sensor histidine kinase YesM
MEKHKKRKKGERLFYRFSSLQLGKKVRYLFLFIIGIYLIFFILLYTFFVRNNLSEYASQKNLNTLTSVSGNFTSEMDRISDMSLLTMSNDAVVTYLDGGADSKTRSTKDTVNALYDMMNVFEGISSIYVFQTDGEYVSAARNVTFASPELLQSAQWNRELNKRAGGFVLTINGNGLFLLKNDVDGNPRDVITFMRVINDLNTQKPIGYLAVNLPITILSDTYSDHSDGDSKFAYFYDGKYICGDNLSAEYSKLSGSDEQYKQIVVGNWGNERIISYYRISGTPLTIVSSESFYAGEMISTEVVVLSISMIILTLAAIALISGFISFYITKPIKGLVHSMDSVAKTGGLQKASLSLPNDEIGHLKNRYNMMLDEIDGLFKELIAKEKKIRSAQLSALQEQIKPHFLYNTLDTLAFMANEAKADEVYIAIQTLASFFTNFLSDGSIEIPLRTEIQIVKDYLKLQKYRYGDIFDDEYECDETLLDIKVPRLILQPLIENALYHGVRLKCEKCKIKISVYKEDSTLHIIVYDSGIGMSEEKIASIMNSDEYDSFGFKGTIERIRYFCDKEDVYEIRSQVGLFTEIDLKIPIK